MTSDAEALMLIMGFKEESMQQSILNDICLVSLNITVWQGRKALQEADLASNGIDTTLLPPAAMATLGSKRIVAPEVTAPFNALKREAARVCGRYGVKFGNSGYAVPMAKADTLCFDLNALKDLFNAAKDDMLLEYQSKLQEWVDQNPPQWKEAILASADSIDHIDRTLTFKFSMLKVEDPTVAGNGLSEEVNDLYGQLCHEIRQMARVAFDTSFKGKKEVTRRAVRPITAILEKLEALELLSPDVTLLIDDIKMTLSALPRSGPINGNDLNSLSGLLASKLCNMGRPIPVEVVEPEIEEWSEPVIEPPTAPPAQTQSITWDF
jgi:hypothetical protein